jgi:thioredoxin 2
MFLFRFPIDFYAKIYVSILPEDRMGESVTVCSNCGVKNRINTPSPDQVPICGQCKHSLPWIVAGTDISFRKELGTSVPVLVDFWAVWCGPCTMVAPILEDLAREKAGQIKILKMDVDQNPATADQFNIRSIPTMMLFKNGSAVETFVGAMSKDALLQRLNQHLSHNAY